MNYLVVEKIRRVEEKPDHLVVEEIREAGPSCCRVVELLDRIYNVQERS